MLCASFEVDPCNGPGVARASDQAPATAAQVCKSGAPTQRYEVVALPVYNVLRQGSLVYNDWLKIQDPEAMLYLHEPILRDGKIVGHLTSGNYGHTLGGSIGVGYVKCPDGVTADYLAAGQFEIDVGGDRIPAKASLRAMYDPKGKRTRT